jgi:chaperonin GroES
VLSIGPDRVLGNGQRVDSGLEVGDTVIFAQSNGTDFKPEDEELLILAGRDIVAVIESTTQETPTL